MNAHTQNEYGFDDGRYDAELNEPIGEYAAGDVLTFDIESEPNAGDIVALRRADMEGVAIGTLLTDLPANGSFAFRGAGGVTHFLKVSDFIGVDAVVGRCAQHEIERTPANDDAPAPKPRKVRPRDAQGRFLPRDHAEPESEVGQPEERKPWEDVADWTAEQRFMFDLEGKLYKMVALAEILETLTTPITNGMARHNRPGAAALDYASTNLVDAVREIEERYMAVRFPDKADAA